MPRLAYSVSFCEQTAAVRRVSARTADVFAAASTMAAAPEPMKHSLSCSQAHSVISFAFRVLWRRREAAHTCALLSQKTGGRETAYLCPGLDSAASASRAR